VRFSFETSREDYLEASKLLARRQKDWLRPLRWSGLGTTAVGFLLLAGNVPHAAQIAPVVLMGTGMFAVLYPIWSSYSLLDKQWERSETVRSEMAVEADDHGISFSNSKMQSTWLWASIAEVRETRSLFVLFTADGEALVSIPKRVLSAPEQTELCRLFAERVATPVKGFPVVVRGNGKIE